MKILHPDNKKIYSLEELKKTNGYYSIISNNEKPELDYFLNAFKKYRRLNNNIIDNISLFKNLPFSIKTNTWKARQKDVKFINRILKNKNKLDILDVGTWNSWLSNHLAKKGHNLTAVGLFTDKYDGLKSKKFYDTEFVSLQLHTNQLYRIINKYDIIIFNRNWAFNENAEKIFNDAKNLLNDKGKILFTGLSFYEDKSLVEKQFKNRNIEFQKLYNIPLLYKKSKSFLDYNDLHFFKENDIKLIPYNLCKNVIKIFFPKKPKLYFGVYSHQINI